jgi:hypothetical protein
MDELLHNHPQFGHCSFDVTSTSFLGAAAVVGFVGKSVMTRAAAAITTAKLKNIAHFLFSVNQILFLTHF